MVIYENAKICPRTKLYLDEGTMIGDFSFICCGELVMDLGAQINRYVEVSGQGKVEIGRFSTIASYATLLTSTDTPRGVMNDLVDEGLRRVRHGDISIGKRCFIGNHAIVMPGVKIGDDCLVHPYAKVSRNMPKKTVCLKDNANTVEYIEREYDPLVWDAIERGGRA